VKKRTVFIYILIIAICILTATSKLSGSRDAQSRTIAQTELNTLMIQVQTEIIDISLLSDVEYIAFARNICDLVDASGTIIKAVHFFRNCFNRAPSTLDEMMKIISQEQGGVFGWKLVNRQNTHFHMFGKNGAFNLKFISADGHFEVVYNQDGLQLTEEIDPANMGTFNFGDSVSEKLKHVIYDILPFFEWGNSSEQEANDIIYLLLINDKSSNAVSRFESYWNALYPHVWIKTGHAGWTISSTLFYAILITLLLKPLKIYVT